MKFNLFNKIAIVFVSVSLLTSMISLGTMSRSVEADFISTYVEFQENSIGLILKNFENLNTQVIQLIDNYSENITLNQHLTNVEEKNSSELFSIYYDIEQITNTSKKNLEDSSVIIEGMNAQFYVDNYRGSMPPWNYVQQDYIEEALECSSESLIYTYGSSGFYDGGYGVMAVKSLTAAFSSQEIGTIYISVDTDTIKALYRDFVTDDITTYVINQDAEVISSSQVSTENTKIENLLVVATNIEKTENIYEIVESGGDRYMYMSAYIPIYGMYIVNEISLESALYDFNQTSANMWIFGTFIMLIGVVVVYFITRRIYEPLNKVIHKISDSNKDEFQKIAGIKSGKEVSNLIQAYNFMIAEIEGYTNELIDVEKGKRLAELAALQMQINPHFLYNTLAVVKYLVWQEEKDKAAKTIEALIDLLQNTISKDDEMLTIQREIDNLRSYIYINEIRYGEDIKVHIFVDDQIKERKVPKLILQPFIENAYFHAFQNKKSGEITLYMNEMDDKLICHIADNGDGIKNWDETKAKQSFTGVGIINVDQRIKMIFGEDYGVNIISEEGKGTKVKIILPIS